MQGGPTTKTDQWRWWARRKGALSTLRDPSSTGGADIQRRGQKRHMRQRHQSRLGEMITLEQRDAGSAQNREFVGILDALGEHGDVELARDADDAGHDDLLGAAEMNIAQQFHID